MLVYELFCGMVEPTEGLALFPAGTAVIGFHHHKSLKCRKQNSKLCRT